MGRSIEKIYPYIISIILTYIFDKQVQPYYCESIINNITSLASIFSTLSGVLLGFIGVIIGVIVSLKESSLIKTLERSTTYDDLKKYIFEAFVVNSITLLYSLIIIIFQTTYSEQLTLYFFIIFLIFLVSLMVFTSFRIIIILFELADINPFSTRNRNNKWNEQKKVFNKDEL